MDSSNSHRNSSIGYTKLSNRYIKIELDEFYRFHQLLFILDPFFMKKIQKYLNKNEQKLKYFPYTFPGFAQRLDQKLKMIYQDRTGCTLSNAELCCSILEGGVWVTNLHPTPPLAESRNDIRKIFEFLLVLFISIFGFSP